MERQREEEKGQGGDNAKEGMHAHVHNVFSYVGVPVTTRENPMANVCGMHRCCILRVARL